MNLLEARRLSLALESAIDRVESVHSRYDELRTLHSLDRLVQSSESGASEVTIEPRTPLLISTLHGSRSSASLNSRECYLAEHQMVIVLAAYRPDVTGGNGRHFRCGTVRGT
jgi:hypothetical protein